MMAKLLLRFVSFCLMCVLSLALPSISLAQNEGVSGTIDITIMPEVGEEFGYEFVLLQYTTTGTSSLDLTGWQFKDNASFVYTFPTIVLNPGEEIRICQKNASSTAAGAVCDLQWTSGSVWNNEGDIFALTDNMQVQIGQTSFGEVGANNIVVDTYEFTYPDKLEASLIIENPVEDDLVLTGTEEFSASFTDDDSLADEIVWYILSGGCDGDEVVLGALDVATSSYSFIDGIFTILVDTEELVNGEYCFVVDPQESEDLETDLKAARMFIVDRYMEPTYTLPGSSFEDVNGNGKFEKDIDVPAGNRHVSAREVDEGTMFVSTTTENGQYQIDIVPGRWIVTEAVPNDWVQTGLTENDVVIYETNLNHATTTVKSCLIELIATEESGVDVIGSCSFLSAKKSEVPSVIIKNAQGTKVAARNLPTPRVLGASSSTVSGLTCGKYLHSYLGAGFANDAEDVARLQLFLTSEGWFTPITGIFDATTETHVKLLQLREKVQILDPWVKAGFVTNLRPTGLVYKTTRAYINNKICPGSEILAW